MTEYIDKAELYGQIAELEEYTRNTLSQLTRANPLFSEYHVRLLERGYLKHLVADFPTADVAPVVHAKWENCDWVEPDYHGCGTIRIPNAGTKCTNCVHVFKKDLLWVDNYCPCCGAKMDLKEDK